MRRQKTRLEKHIGNLEQTHRHLIDFIEDLPEEMYHHQISPSQWSIAQAANHVYLSEKLSLAYLTKKLNYPESIPDYHPKSWVSLFALKISLKSPLKFKAPPNINMWQDQSILSQQDLKQKWRILRDELFDFIRTHDAIYGTHLVYRHPFTGRMTMSQMLIFLNDHMKHHYKQIHRIHRQLPSKPE